MKILKKSVVFVLAVCAVLAVYAVPASADDGVICWGAATVDTASLNIRSGPGTDYDRVGIISGGTIVVVVEKTSDEWFKINYNGVVGYVASEYLTEILKAENFKATGTVIGDDVRMRKGPSTSKDVMTHYDKGKSVSIIGINDGWFKVVTEDGTGYIRSDYIEITAGGPSYTTNEEESTDLGRQIANYALQFVGYNYVYGEESPEKGFDCSGLMYYVYGQFGYKLERRASMQQAHNGKAIKKSELQPGDLIFFSSNGSTVSHVGMYIGNGQFVHASTSKTGVIISNLDSTYYTNHYYSASRII